MINCIQLPPPHLSRRWDDELCHHGILGQKWGIRRFQNPDGSLTEAGRRRYGYSRRSTTSLSDDSLNTLRKKYGRSSDVYLAELKKSVDFRDIKDKRKKAKEEMKIMEPYNASPEKWEKYSELKQDKCVYGLGNRIKKEACDWYNSKANGPESKKYFSEYEKVRDDYRSSGRNNDKISKLNEAENNLLGAVLRDIGYEDTKEARDAIRYMVFDD